MAHARHGLPREFRLAGAHVEAERREPWAVAKPGAPAHADDGIPVLAVGLARAGEVDDAEPGDVAGQVELKLKTPWRDGTSHLVMSPPEFMQRLAALVPRPRLHLIRFHGVLAPNAKLRPVVVPQALPAQAQAATEGAATAECEVETVQAGPHRIGWARLLKRVFDIDMQHCPNCGGGEFKIIAAILERPVVEKILTHLGLNPQPRATLISRPNEPQANRQRPAETRKDNGAAASSKPSRPASAAHPCVSRAFSGFAGISRALQGPGFAGAV